MDSSTKVPNWSYTTAYGRAWSPSSARTIGNPMKLELVNTTHISSAAYSARPKRNTRLQPHSSGTMIAVSSHGVAITPASEASRCRRGT